MDNEEELSGERPRPKVVDKRISARGTASAPRETSSGPAEPAPEPVAEAPTEPAPQETEGGLPSDPDLWTPEQEAEARRMAEEVARTPSLEWVVNIGVTLANVAGTKLDLGATADAQLAIDALAALIEKLGSRLDRAEAPLRQTLAQLQLAFAERSGDVAPPATQE
jgi:hypothetical protein